MTTDNSLGDQHKLRNAFSWRCFLGIAVLAAALLALSDSISSDVLVEAVVLLGLALSYAALAHQSACNHQHIIAALSILHAPLRLAERPEFFEQYSSLLRALLRLSEQTDHLLREFALMKLGSLTHEVRLLAAGEVVFTNTESWRTAYERLLQSPGLGEYLSVAWVKSADYWRDAPGRQSLRLNYEVAARGLRIERFIILRDSLWPPGDRWPTRDILEWIDEQHQHGLVISLARESALLAEPDLLCDFGIYGARAVGIHERDEQSRTLRFVLHFDRQQLALAHDRWSRLSLYGEWYSVLLDGTR